MDAILEYVVEALLICLGVIGIFITLFFNYFSPLIPTILHAVFCFIILRYIFKKIDLHTSTRAFIALSIALSFLISTSGFLSHLIGRNAEPKLAVKVDLQNFKLHKGQHINFYSFSNEFSINKRPLMAENLVCGFLPSRSSHSPDIGCKFLSPNERNIKPTTLLKMYGVNVDNDIKSDTVLRLDKTSTSSEDQYWLTVDYRKTTVYQGYYSIPNSISNGGWLSKLNDWVFYGSYWNEAYYELGLLPEYKPFIDEFMASKFQENPISVKSE